MRDRRPGEPLMYTSFQPVVATTKDGMLAATARDSLRSNDADFAGAARATDRSDGSASGAASSARGAGRRGAHDHGLQRNLRRAATKSVISPTFGVAAQLLFTQRATEEQALSKTKAFKPNPHRYYDLGALVKLVEVGDVALLRGKWLLDRYAEWSYRPPSFFDSLPRRQEMPREAFWQSDEFSRLLRNQRLEVIAVSHCWFTKQHPDPHGDQLQILWRAVELKMREVDVAIFLDWCSLYQHPRTLAEQSTFDKSKAETNLIYAHHHTAVWRLTDVPQHILQYDDRGWTTFERTVSDLCAHGKVVLDLGNLQKFRTFTKFKEVEEACTVHRSPPLLPSEFSFELQSKKFANGRDRAILVRKYRESFLELLGLARQLSFSRLAWGEEELMQLAKVLPHCEKVQRLDLGGNEMEGTGAEALAEALSQCGSVVELALKTNGLGAFEASVLASALPHCSIRALDLSDNSIGAEGAVAVARALPRSRLEELNLEGNDLGNNGAVAIAEAIWVQGSLSDLSLRGNGIGDAGAAALAAALGGAAGQQRGLRRMDHSAAHLTQLDLRDNVIGDEGAEAFAAVLPTCTSLEFLNLNFNRIGGEAAQKLREAWAGPAKHRDYIGLHVQQQQQQLDKVAPALSVDLSVDRASIL